MQVLHLVQVDDAVHVAGAPRVQRDTGTQDIEFLYLCSSTVRAAAAAEIEAQIEGPHIPCPHHHIDAPIVKTLCPDRGVIEIPRRAQDALRLIQHASRIWISGLKQQLRTDHVRPRLDVDAVREPEEPVVLAWVGEVEDIFIVDHHLSDQGVGPLELLV